MNMEVLDTEGPFQNGSIVGLNDESHKTRIKSRCRIDESHKTRIESRCRCSLRQTFDSFDSFDKNVAVVAGEAMQDAALNGTVPSSQKHARNNLAAGYE